MAWHSTSLRIPEKWGSCHERDTGVCEKRLSKSPVYSPKGARGDFFFSDGNVLYCHCGDGYTFVKTCICTFKIGQFIVCKLYTNKVD